MWGDGRLIMQGHSTHSCFGQGAARDAEGTDPCVGGGPLRLCADSLAQSCGFQGPSTPWFSESKEPPFSQVSEHWECICPCVWRKPDCCSLKPTENIQYCSSRPSSPDQESPVAHFSPFIPLYPRDGCFP